MRTLSALAIFALAVCSALAAGEPFRPAFHFTPEKNWMNDPNGMVFLEGEWHLFFQYNPHGNAWGHMSWGHAVSRDLVRWEHLPLALAEEDGVMVFFGSAVVDAKNTSGFGAVAQDGETVLTELIFPTAGARSLSMGTDGDATRIGAIEIHALRSSQ